MLMKIIEEGAARARPALDERDRVAAAERKFGKPGAAAPAANDDALIDPAVLAEAVDRHLTFLREMSELGMTLARVATRRALAEAEAAEEAAALAAEGSAPEGSAAETLAPGAAAEAILSEAGALSGDPRLAGLARRLAGRAAERQDWGLMFARATRAARLAITIEARVLQDPRMWALRARANSAADAAAKAAGALQAKIDAYELRPEDVRPVKADPVRKKKFTIWRAIEMIVQWDGDRDDFENGDTLGVMFSLLEHEPKYENYVERDMSETLAWLCQDLDLTARWADWHMRGWTISLDEARARGHPYILPGHHYAETPTTRNRSGSG